MGGILNENSRTIMNGAYSCIFNTNIPGLRCAPRIVCVLNTLGFYCVTITYSSLEYSRIFWLARTVNWLNNICVNFETKRKTFRHNF